MARAYRTAVTLAPIEKVWATVRDFNALPSWHPSIARSEIEDRRASDSVGCIRNFYLRDGGHLREQLLALSDIDHSFTYSILESPMPVRNYVASFKLTRITAGANTLAEWVADFDITNTDDMVTNIGDGVFLAGFEALNAKLTV